MSQKDKDNTERFSVDNYERPVLETPNGSDKLFLHSCCAPCAAEIMDALAASEIDTTIFFYNPNIHPRDEYNLRKEENIRYAEKLGMDFIDGDYDVREWFDLTKGMENEPERGIRCTACFDMRFDVTADYAAERGFNLISSTLGISRWKNMNQINGCGERAAQRHEGMSYWTFNWRKQGGSQRMIEISKNEEFYQQEYCGFVYSLRDTNKWRQESGRPKVKRLVKFYGRDAILEDAEEAEES
ncbi:MAG: epoxyqueuosine reductase QueH [Verrucomicrobiota bacterium]